MSNSGLDHSVVDRRANMTDPQNDTLLNGTLWTIPEEPANGTSNSTVGGTYQLPPNSSMRIALYSIIFVLAVIGNVLVLVTLAQNKRMRTVTNMFLLNLAISDLLLCVFCMPASLIGGILRNFIFGPVMCYLMPYLQAVSVSVSAWTLVVISLERYFAICRPLHSRRWQTLSHVYRVISAIWLGSLTTMLPIACFSELQPTRVPGKFKCRENWPSPKSEKVFNVYLDIALLLVPLVMMASTYSLIARTLYSGIKVEVPKKSNLKYSNKDNKKISNSSSSYELNCNGNHQVLDGKGAQQPKRKKHAGNWIVRSNHGKSQEGKKRVIKMLFAVVVEFFICWTPVYLLNTWAIFDSHSAYNNFNHLAISIIHLLSYISCCCNPITYCFMHKKFRQGFINAIRCTKRTRWKYSRSSDYSATLNSVYSMRLSSTHAEVVEKDEDDCV